MANPGLERVLAVVVKVQTRHDKFDETLGLVCIDLDHVHLPQDAVDRNPLWGLIDPKLITNVTATGIKQTF
ncbi:hypothetical protein [Brevundimonas sp. SL130]|uniref:hypothetical protein n=1 Tax=Brevundimonas sp. SL130 TaxID=2995143 RepID=UPI00226C7D47|nr:hypothetical protein [Brevundimonas sp. SL130]WAC59746.1 hypothetical protein OU998_16300 [Brevundimonas sp. SL130]